MVTLSVVTLFMGPYFPPLTLCREQFTQEAGDSPPDWDENCHFYPQSMSP